ncbi:uncharacterized protein MELLADRAFT_104494 [Melampsora larici-populina 98AG31]|uniref:Uncharacterized protein n=1 Tax=Melampsora larici-populina (strain 98AG31 / pathotype 3-4-7) TaxID=747676 RepID=F4REW2_MELLP|nr:uncharacterized protein MELLADRAFT_104494 [Melampsora larici-populina 98AG31]EGG09176.1 hypothetical protein MELLADRAFT_104494 [Melampsora larici-populina 98AG31]
MRRSKCAVEVELLFCNTSASLIKFLPKPSQTNGKESNYTGKASVDIIEQQMEKNSLGDDRIALFFVAVDQETSIRCPGYFASLAFHNTEVFPKIWASLMAMLFAGHHDGLIPNPALFYGISLITTSV